MTKTAIIADSHLGGPGGDGRLFVEQLEALPSQGCGRLILLGDIFHVWVGFQKYETPEVRRVLPALEALRRQGIRLEYIEGNRDFFIAEGPYARYFDAVATETTVEIDGVRCLAVHGDGLNEQDRQYLFWRWLSKSLPVRLVVRHLPAAITGRLMHRTEARLAQTNFKHRTAIPKGAITGYAQSRFLEGHRVLYLGHFHEPHTWSTEDGEIRLLDAWFNSHRIEWVTALSGDSME